MTAVCSSLMLRVSCNESTANKLDVFMVRYLVPEAMVLSLLSELEKVELVLCKLSLHLTVLL